MFFLKMISRSFSRQFKRRLLIAVTVCLSATVSVAMLGVVFDVGDKLNAELSTYGSNITVQPKDQISIMVSSKDPQLAALFNLTRVQYRAGTTDLRSSNNNGEISGYTLDDKGNIDFPVIGTLHIAGMTKSQIAALIKKRLMEEDLVKDPVVTVEFMNLLFLRVR